MSPCFSIAFRFTVVLLLLGLVLGRAVSQEAIVPEQSRGSADRPAPNEVGKLPPPPWVELHEFDPYEEPEEEENIGSVYFHVIDSQRDTASDTEYFRYIKRLMTESGVEDNSQLSVSFDPTYQRLVFHSLLVHRGGKAIDKLPNQKIKVIERESNHEKQLYDGSLSAILLIEDIRSGDAIEYSFSLIGKNPVMEKRFSDSFSTNYSFPVGHLRSSIRWSGERELKIKHFSTELTPKITKQPDHTLYEWSDDHIPALLSEGGLPDDYSPWGWVDLSDYESWAEVKDWAMRQYNFPDEMPPSLKKEIEPLLAAAESQEDKIKVALRYVQDEYRYLGIFSGVHSHKPYPIETIVKRRFGDCKDKALILTTILRSIGVEAHPTLVETDFRGAIANWLPSPYAFDHLVVTVRPGDGKTIRLDPTRRDQRGRLEEIYFPHYGKALVISPESSGLEDVVPQGYEVEETEILEIYDFPDYRSDATLKVKTIYRGHDADTTRDYFTYNGAEEVEQEYLNFYSTTYPDIEFAGPIRTEDDEEKNVFIVSEEYLVPNIWNAYDEDDPDEGYEVELFGKSVYQRIRLPSTRKRTQPYALSYPQRYKQTIRATFHTETDFDGTDLEVDDPAFHFTAKEQPQAKGIKLIYTYEAKKDRVAGKRIAEYIRNAKKAENKLSYYIWIPKNLHLGIDSDDSGAEFSFRPNVVLIALILTTLFGTALFARMVFRWSPKPPRETPFSPHLRGIVGWLVVIAIGIVLWPLISAVQIGTFLYYNDLESWVSSVSPDGDYYDPLWQYLLTLEAVLVPFYFVIEILILVLFFGKKYTLPKVAIAYFALYCLSAWVLWALAIGIETFDSEYLAQYFADALVSTFRLIIWGTYFAVSRRVKMTFVNGIPDNKTHPSQTEKPKEEPPPLPVQKAT